MRGRGDAAAATWSLSGRHRHGVSADEGSTPRRRRGVSAGEESRPRRGGDRNVRDGRRAPRPAATSRFQHRRVKKLKRAMGDMRQEFLNHFQVELLKIPRKIREMKVEHFSSERAPARTFSGRGGAIADRPRAGRGGAAGATADRPRTCRGGKDGWIERVAAAPRVPSRIVRGRVAAAPWVPRGSSVDGLGRRRIVRKDGGAATGAKAGRGRGRGRRGTPQKGTAPRREPRF